MFYSDTFTLVNHDFSINVLRLILFSCFGFVSNISVYLANLGLKFKIALICIFDQGHVNVMQCNGFSNLELFWTKVWKMGFELGGIHSRLSDDLLKVDAVVDGRSWYTFSV